MLKERDISDPSLTAVRRGVCFRSEDDFGRIEFSGLFYICQHRINNQQEHSTHWVFNYAHHHVSRNLNINLASGVIKKRTVQTHTFERFIAFKDFLLATFLNS